MQSRGHVRRCCEGTQTNGPTQQAVMQLRGVLRTIRCHIEGSTQEPVRDDSPVLPQWVEHAVNILSRCQKGRDGWTHLRDSTANDHTKNSLPVALNGMHVYSCSSVLPSDCLLVACVAHSEKQNDLHDGQVCVCAR